MSTKEKRKRKWVGNNYQTVHWAIRAVLVIQVIFVWRKKGHDNESKQKLLTTIAATASTTTEDAAAAAEHDRLTRSLANVVCGWCMPESKEQQQQHWQHRRRICRSAQPLTKRQWSTIWSLFCCCCCSAIFQDLVSTFSFTAIASARVAACGCVIGCCWCWCSSSRGHPKRETER